MMIEIRSGPGEVRAGWLVSNSPTRLGCLWPSSNMSDGANQVPAEAVARVRATLDSAGVMFVPEDGGGTGVRFRAVREAKYLGWEDLNASNYE